MNHDEFDAEKFLKRESDADPTEKLLKKKEKKEKMKKELENHLKKKESRDDPISTASLKTRQSNQSLIKEENAGDSSSMDVREKIEEVDNFIETTDKTVVDKLNKKRIISRCK